MASKGPKRVGRYTGVHIDRKPNTFYYVDKRGEVREKPRKGGKGVAGRSTGKHVQRKIPGSLVYVDGRGDVRELERARKR
jgi:hypothetical protein